MLDYNNGVLDNGPLDNGVLDQGVLDSPASEGDSSNGPLLVAGAAAMALAAYGVYRWRKSVKKRKAAAASEQAINQLQDFVDKAEKVAGTEESIDVRREMDNAIADMLKRTNYSSDAIQFAQDAQEGNPTTGEEMLDIIVESRLVA